MNEDSWPEAPSASVQIGEETWPFPNDGLHEHGEPLTFHWNAGADDVASAHWVLVEGGMLTQPIRIRVGKRGGQLRITGVIVSNDREVTSDSLRFPIRQVLERLLSALGVADFDPAGLDLAGVQFKEHQIVWEAWLETNEFLAEHVSELPAQTPPARKGRPPSDAALKAFARVYLEETRAHPQRAMTLTARSQSMARSTAYRWLDECRARGYVPQKQEES